MAAQSRPPFEVQVVARDTGDRYTAQRHNAALDLADALGEAVPGARRMAMGYIAKKQEKEALDAEIKALAGSGKAYADAVRAKEIDGTQSPFWIKVHDTKAAAVRAEAELTALQTQSLTWEERKDPVAFQQKWDEGLAEIASKYTTKDAREGFLPVAEKYRARAISANQEQVVSRMLKENVSNTKAVAASAILDVHKRTGSATSPEATYAALAPIREEFIGTGGTEEEWKDILADSFNTAAFTSKDSSLLDHLGVPYAEGQLPVAASPNVAQQMSQWKFYVDQAALSSEKAEMNRLEAEDTAAADQYVRKLQEDPATRDAVAGLAPFNLREFYATADAQGIPRSVSNKAAEAIQKNLSVSTRLAASRHLGDTTALDMSIAAKRDGYSPQFEARVRDALQRGDITPDEADSLISSALSETKTDERAAKSDARAQAAEARRAYADRYKSADAAATDAVDAAIAAGRIPPKARAEAVTFVKARARSADPSLLMDTVRSSAATFKPATKASTSGAIGLATGPGNKTAAASAAAKLNQGN